MNERRPTEAQSKARMRNWGIRNLRALYALSFSLTGERRAAAHAAIDAELALRGAETTEARREALNAKWAAEDAARGTPVY